MSVESLFFYTCNFPLASLFLFITKRVSWAEIHISVLWLHTCHEVELAPLQDDSEDEDELGRALGKRLYEPQHAEVVAQGHSGFHRFAVVGGEALYSDLQYRGVPVRAKSHVT